LCEGRLFWENIGAAASIILHKPLIANDLDRFHLDRTGNLTRSDR